MKQVYATFILNTKDGSEHPFLVYVPDMEIFTEGDSLADSIEMARDAIGLAGISMEDHKEEIPAPSDFTEYRKRVDTKTVRRNVALPGWLDYEAEHAGINVSRVLQEALMNVLNVKRNI